MGLFDKFSKNRPPSGAAKHTGSHSPDGISLLDKHEKGLLDDQAFLSAFGKVTVYYSTPFGDHKDGDTRLFALPAQDKTGYLPVFTSSGRAIEFYEKAGRVGYLIMDGTFQSFLETTNNINQKSTPVKLGAVIDPGYYGVTIGADMLGQVLGVISG
ncbi:SseB family protein [Ruminococcaceae bacterium OttesenSCG-928-A16]|nr:SseB family protein [Ruminococcaceae bacterium OttesenSCG-928-A16]